jgi:hypothetical protein
MCSVHRELCSMFRAQRTLRVLHGVQESFSVHRALRSLLRGFSVYCALCSAHLTLCTELLSLCTFLHTPSPLHSSQCTFLRAPFNELRARCTVHSALSSLLHTLCTWLLLPCTVQPLLYCVMCTSPAPTLCTVLYSCSVNCALLLHSAPCIVHLSCMVLLPHAFFWPHVVYICF